MKCSEVTKEDVSLASQLINTLKIGRWSLGVNDACALTDAIRWLQGVAVSVSKGYQESVLKKDAPAAPANESDPPENSGLKIKAYSPGRIGKK